MIKVCWKCKSDFDTQKVDESVTVGLCQGCYDRFDEPEPPTPVVVEVTETQPTGEATSREVTVQVPPPADFVYMVTLGGTTMGMDMAIPEAEATYLTKKVLDALSIPEEMREAPPKADFGTVGSLERLSHDMTVIIDTIRASFVDNGDIAAMKNQLRVASIEALQRNAPVNIPTEFIEKVVNECIEASFKNYVPPPPLPAPAEISGA